MISPFLRGVLLILAAMFLFDVMAAIIKHLGAGYPAQLLSMFRNIFGLLPSLLVLFLSRDWHRAGRPLRMRQWRLGLARGLLVALAQLCLYTSLMHLELATASTLAFAGPLFITALSVPILKQPVGTWRWAAVGIGFAGIVMIMQPGSDLFTPYALLPLGAAFGYATSSILVKKVDEEIPSATINLYASVGALAGSVILVAGTGAYRPIAGAEDWLWLIAMGAVGGFAVLALITAYRATAPSNLAPFEYFGIPFSYVIGWHVFGEAPFDRLVPGAFLIVAGGLLIFWRQRYREKHRAAEG